MKMAAADSSKRKVFVKGISPRINDNDLMLYFSRFGKVARAYTLRNSIISNEKTFGYIEFLDEKSVQGLFAEESNSHVIGGTTIRCYKYTDQNKQKERKGAKPGSKTSPDPVSPSESKNTL